MAATSELTVLLRTVADTSGARQTQEALQQVQRQTAAANRPVQTPGIPPAVTTSILQFAGALGIATTAQQLFQQVVQAGIQLYTSSAQVAREHERVIRATAMAYGQSAGQYQQFAKQLEATTGFTSDAILEAALSARTLSQNYGLTIQQTQRLITASADLARVRGIGIAEAFERVQSAIRGEAEASEYLGLTLNDTYLTNQAMNGSLKNTFGTMTDVQKAQVRYNELLRQSAQFSGLAANASNSLDGAMVRAATSTHNFQLALGEATKPSNVTAIKAVTVEVDLLTEALKAIKEIGPAVVFSGPTAIGPIAAEIAENRGKEADAAKRQLATEAEIARIRGNLPGLNISSDLQRGEQALAEQNRVRAHYATEESKALYAREQQLRNQDEQRLSRLREINDAPTPTLAVDLARIALTDQLRTAAQDLIAAQYEQRRLQEETVNLSAEEARIKLGQLPVQQQLAAMQRDITEQQVRARLAALPATEHLQDLQRAQQVSQLIEQTNTSLQEQQIRARIAALPAVEALQDLQRAQEIARLVAQTNTSLQQNMLQARLAAMPASEALEDLQYEQQRQQLISRDRNRSAQERSAARRELRDLNRREPGVALSALEAGRGVTSAQRATERADIQQQMVNLADQAALATAQLAATQAQGAELEAKRAADRASLDQQLKDLAEQATLAVAQLAVIEAQRGELEAGRAAERFDIAQQLQAIADARALQPVLDAEQANQLQQTIAAAVTQGQEAILKQILAQVRQPITLNFTVTLPDGTVLTATELIEANSQAVIPPAIQLSGLRRG